MKLQRLFQLVQRSLTAWLSVVKTPHLSFREDKPHLWWLEYLIVLVVVGTMGRLLNDIPLPVFHPFSMVTLAELVLLLPVLIFAMLWGWGPGIVAALDAGFWWYQISPFADEPQVFSYTVDALSIISAAIIFLVCAFVVGAVAVHNQQRKERLREAVDRYRDMNAQKEEFLSIIAHELRTPLTSASMALQLSYRLSENSEQLSVDDIFARGEELREVIDQQIVRMTNMLNDMTEAVRVANNKIRYDPTEFDIGELIENTVAEARVLFPARTISYRRPRVKLLVSGDIHRVSQVLHNYLNNAVKFSEAAYPVGVSCLREDDKVSVTVRDNGVGIAKEQQEAIWGRFYQVRDSSSPQQDSSSYIGFGVGLYVVKSLIEAMGGEVGVRSALGAGSAFWFTLPLSDSREILRDTLPDMPTVGRFGDSGGVNGLRTLRPQRLQRSQRRISAHPSSGFSAD